MYRMNICRGQLSNIFVITKDTASNIYGQTARRQPYSYRIMMDVSLIVQRITGSNCTSINAYSLMHDPERVVINWLINFLIFVSCNGKTSAKKCLCLLTAS